MRLGEEFWFSVGSGLPVRWVVSGANRHDWRDLSSAFVKTFITEYFVGLVVQASSYVFNGGAEPKLTDTVLISFGVIVCLFVSLLLRVVWGAAAFPSWGSDGRESPSRAVLRRPARPSRPRRLYSPRGPWIWPGIIRLVYPGSGHTASHAVFGALTGPESWPLGPVEVMGASGAGGGPQYGIGIVCSCFVCLFDVKRPREK